MPNPYIVIVVGPDLIRAAYGPMEKHQALRLTNRLHRVATASESDAYPQAVELQPCPERLLNSIETSTTPTHASPTRGTDSNKPTPASPRPTPSSNVTNAPSSE